MKKINRILRWFGLYSTALYGLYIVLCLDLEYFGLDSAFRLRWSDTCDAAARILFLFALAAGAYGSIDSNASGYNRVLLEAIKLLALLSFSIAFLVSRGYLWHLLRIRTEAEAAMIVEPACCLFGLAAFVIAACYAFATRR